MKKYIASVLFLFSALLGAQTTTVSGTVTDTDGQVWTTASVSIQFTPNPAYPNLSQYAVDGVSITSNSTYLGYLQQNVTASATTGQFTATVIDVKHITPVGSTWKFIIKPNASVQATVYAPIAITGTSQDISAFLSSNSTVVRFPAIGYGAYGYADAEVTPVPNSGGFYFNVTTALQGQRFWNGTQWVVGGGGSVTVPVATYTTAGSVPGGQAYVYASQVNGANDACQALNSAAASVPNNGTVDSVGLGAAVYTCTHAITGFNNFTNGGRTVHWHKGDASFIMNVNLGSTKAATNCALQVGNGSSITSEGYNSFLPNFTLGSTAVVWAEVCPGDLLGNQESLKIDGVVAEGNPTATVGSGYLWYIAGIFTPSSINNSGTILPYGGGVDFVAGTTGSGGAAIGDLTLINDLWQDDYTGSTVYAGCVVNFDSLTSAGEVVNINFFGGMIQLNGPHNPLLCSNGHGGVQTGSFGFYGTTLQGAAATTSGSITDVNPVQLLDTSNVYIGNLYYQGANNSTYQNHLVEILGSAQPSALDYGIQVNQASAGTGNFTCLIYNNAESATPTCETGTSNGNGRFVISNYVTSRVFPFIRQTNYAPHADMCVAATVSSIWQNSADTTSTQSNCTSVSGTPTWIKPTTISATPYYPIVGNSSNQVVSSPLFYDAAQFPGSDAGQKINFCNAALIANGGGTCDDRAVLNGGQVATAEIDIGDTTNTSLGINHILPDAATLTITFSNSAKCGIRVYSGATIEGSSNGGGGNRTHIFAGTGSTMHSLLCTDTGQAYNSYWRIGNMGLYNSSNATMSSGYLIDIEDAVDESYVHDVFGTDSNASENTWFIGSACCGATFERIQGYGSLGPPFSSGGIPLTVGGGASPGNFVQAITIKDSTFNGSKVGQPDIKLTGSVWNFTCINCYSEGNGSADTTTSQVYIDTGVSAATFIGGMIQPNCTSACAGKYAFENHSAGTIKFQNVSQGGSSTSGPFLNDVAGGNTYAGTANFLGNTFMLGPQGETSSIYSTPITGAFTCTICTGPFSGFFGSGSSGVVTDVFGMVNSNYVFDMQPTNIQFRPNVALLFDNSSFGPDTGLYRDTATAPLLDVGLLSSLSLTPIQSNAFEVGGTTFTVTGCGTATALVGGSTAGHFAAASTTCAPVVTTTGFTAKHGFICSMADRTTPADFTSHYNTSDSITTATWPSQTVVSGDVMAFSCTPY